MKKSTYYIRIIACIFAVIFCIIAGGCENTNFSEGNLIRFHIRAHSNAEFDQQVKLKVRDEIVEFLESKKLGDSVSEAYAELKKLMPRLKEIADDTLKRNGALYESSISLDKQYFPARAYGEIVIDSGYYDALIIELGNGVGDNWWCVVYPPLCYLEAKAETNVRYKSKIVELIKKYFCLSQR